MAQDQFEEVQAAGEGATITLPLPGGLYIVGTIAKIDAAQRSVKFRDGREVRFAPLAEAAADEPHGEEA